MLMIRAVILGNANASILMVALQIIIYMKDNCVIMPPGAGIIFGA